MIFCTAVTLISVAALLIAFRTGHHNTGAFFKMAASTGFIAMGIAAGGFQTAYGWLILLGLFFSWWGDYFLLSGTDRIFLLGLIAFFLAHVVYAAAFLWQGVHFVAAAVSFAGLCVPAVMIIIWLWPHLGEMRAPVLAYVFVITLMVSLASGMSWRWGKWMAVTGALIFYASDIFVARDRFVSPGPVNGLIGLPLYYIGQLLLAWSAGMGR